MAKQPTWYDLLSGDSKGIKKTYKLNDRQLEIATRRHMDSATPQERRDLYRAVWDTKK